VVNLLRLQKNDVVYEVSYHNLQYFYISRSRVVKIEASADAAEIDSQIFILHVSWGRLSTNIIMRARTALVHPRVMFYSFREALMYLFKKILS